ncbi:MAG: polyhydroxyalkanoic acid system family protein [Bacteroidetes bacterium]|nr:polyhydroxyalkanoic acid system family protein [Bacteroidota bacterium]
MPTLEISIPHNLPQQEALQRIKRLLSETKREHGDKIQNLTETWNGNEGNFSFKAMGYDISGTLTVTPATVELAGKIPFAVSLFKGQITKMINEKAGQLLQT